MQDKDDSALGKYIGEICKVEVLSEAEESELAARRAAQENAKT